MPAFSSSIDAPPWIMKDERLSVFENVHKFHDNIHGTIHLNQVERDVIDAPEFQRLGSIMQLGVIPLLFRTATHTRFAHSLGSCWIAKHLTRLVNRNTAARTIE